MMARVMRCRGQEGAVVIPMPWGTHFCVLSTDILFISVGTLSVSAAGVLMLVVVVRIVSGFLGM